MACRQAIILCNKQSFLFAWLFICLSPLCFRDQRQDHHDDRKNCSFRVACRQTITTIEKNCSFRVARCLSFFALFQRPTSNDHHDHRKTIPFAWPFVCLSLPCFREQRQTTITTIGTLFLSRGLSSIFLCHVLETNIKRLSRRQWNFRIKYCGSFADTTRKAIKMS